MNRGTPGLRMRAIRAVPSRPWPNTLLQVQWEDLEFSKEKSMSTDGSIKQRLAAVERAADLQHKLASRPPARSWLERFTGALKDEPAFAEVITYGRAIRAADRPPEDAEP